MRPRNPCSTLSASTFSRLISTVSRLMKPNLAITRRLVMAISVERTLTHAAISRKSPTTTTRSRMPRNTSQNCDHQDTRARWRMVSPWIRESSMYDMSGLQVGCRDEIGDEPLERARVFVVEAIEGRAVEVEHADDPIVAPAPD